VRAGTSAPFELWREAVGFAPGFPRLGPVGGCAGVTLRPGGTSATNEQIYLSQVHRDAFREMLDIGPGHVVATATGHGATTLARLAFDAHVGGALVRRSVPVLISIEDLLSEPYDRLLDIAVARDARISHDADDAVGQRDAQRDLADATAQPAFAGLTVARWRSHLEAAVHIAAVRLVLSQPMDRVIPARAYADLLGVELPTRNVFEDRRNQLRPFVDGAREPAWSMLDAHAPRLSDGHALVRSLNQHGNFRVNLIVDLSPTPVGRCSLGSDGEYLTDGYLQAIASFARAWKGLLNVDPDVLARCIDVTVLIPGSAIATLEMESRGWRLPRTDFPPYRSIDLFAMLARRYPPHSSESGRRSEVLAAVLDTSYVQLDRHTAISTALLRVERQLRSDMDDETDVRYRRSPLGHTGNRVDEVEQIKLGIEDMRARLSRIEQELRK